MRATWGAIVVALFLGGGTTTQLGCSPCSVQGHTPIVFTDGIVNESRTIYQSNEVDGEMLHFPEGRRYDLVHGLASTPAIVIPYVSFRETLDPDGDPNDKTKPNNLSVSAGNQTVIEGWDDKVIHVRNDTCAEFYLRVVALADPVTSKVSEGMAGAKSE